MQSEMPRKYWRNLPEAELIAPLIANAKSMEQEMLERTATHPPSRHVRHARARRTWRRSTVTTEIVSLADARASVQGCQRCPLYQYATQAVFGEGPEHAEVMFVGEQPGDQEDLAGKPFVGPAGKMLDAAIAGSRDRPQAGLCHQCGQALQVHAARQAAHPQQARPRRDRRLPVLAQPRARVREAQGDRRARRDRRHRSFWARRPRSPRCAARRSS